MRDAGLGAFPTVSLVKARKQAGAYRQLAQPASIQSSNATKSAGPLASPARAMTFERCAKAFIASHEFGWKQQLTPPPVAGDAWRLMCLSIMGDLPG